MKKMDLLKTMLLSAAMLSSVCLLGGCAGSEAKEETILYQQEPPKETQPTIQTSAKEEPSK